MSADNAHLLTPDPREDRTAQWTQRLLRKLRHEIVTLQAAVDVLQGQHPGSNVVLCGSMSGDDIPLPENARVKFLQAWGGVQVYHDRDGKVRIQGDSSLLVRLSAGNACTVELEV